MKMDLSEYSREEPLRDFNIYCTLRKFDSYENRFIPRPMSFSGIQRATLEGNVRMVKLMVESGVSVNVMDSRFGFTPLHMAVITNNVEMLDYLLSLDDILMNGNYNENVSPLRVAAEVGHMESARKLIEAGAIVNFGDCRNNTPLQRSMCHPELGHFLIQKGARIDTTNYAGETPLHTAARVCVETVCLLLYYGADANARDDNGFIPFTCALQSTNVDIQRVLFDYVGDFDDSYILESALRNNSPLIADIIERGADVNYGDYEGVDAESSAFNCCLEGRVNTEVFKLVWDKISYNKIKNTIDLYAFYRSSIHNFRDYLQVIIESDNFEPAVESLMANKSFCACIESSTSELELEQLTTFACRLLQYGYRATSQDVSVVFSCYGFCELMRILLYMDIDCTKGWPRGVTIPRMMFDLDYELPESEILYFETEIGKEKFDRDCMMQNMGCTEGWLRSITRMTDGLDYFGLSEREIFHVLTGFRKETFDRDFDRSIATLLEYFTYPSLINALVRSYGEGNRRELIPSLMELARDVARRYIWNSLKVKTTCQFYTAIDNLKIPSPHKKILTFERKLYSVYV